MHQLKIHIQPENEGDKQEIDSLSRSLLGPLSHLNVEEVNLLYENPPPSSKAVEGVALGLMVAFVSSGLIKEILKTVQRWMGRNENLSLTMELCGDKLELRGFSAKDQQSMVDAWVKHHEQKMK